MGAYAAATICYGDTEANGAPRVHVKGAARLEARITRASGKLALSGTLADDAGRPLVAAGVGLTLVRASLPAPGPAPADASQAADAPIGVALAAARPEACDGDGARPVLERGDLLLLRTDGGGRFCVRLALTTDRYVAHLDARASAYVDGAHIDVPMDLSRAPVTLRFDPEGSASISLDDDTTTVASVAVIEDDGIGAAAAGLGLSLSNELGTELGEATTDASGRAVFHVPSTRLGPAGPGELRVAFAGKTDAGAASHAIPVERRTRVELLVSDGSRERPSGERLRAASPEDGIALRLSARPRCGNGCVATPTGTVEARVGSAIVGAAPIERGEARLVITFAMPSTPEVPVSVRYVPDAPWFRAEDDLSLVQPVRVASPWSKAPLLLAAAAVVGWMALGRIPLRSRQTNGAGAPDRPSRSPRRSGAAGASLELVRVADSPQGWTGTVVDAHDGLAVAGAHVSIERAGFEHTQTIVETASDPAGAFALPAVDARPGDELVAEGPLHAALRRPVPRSGHLAIALSQRRRALLERLVGWARAELTPAQVRQAAGADGAIARWADAVERAAYGGEVIDKRAENEVDGLAPEERPEIVSRRRR